MTFHPNLNRVQAMWDGVRNRDYGPAFDEFTDDVIMINGPGAGPWHRAANKEDLGLLMLEFVTALDGTFHQDGRCVYADDRVAVSLVHETGKAPGGDVFDNLAVYVSRFGLDGRTERVWTVDLDTEHCEEFWRNNKAAPSRDFS